jgi:serine/threonine protein kinase
MRKLDSEHTIRLYEVYETVNSVYLVIDLLEGGELLNAFSMPLNKNNKNN